MLEGRRGKRNDVPTGGGGDSWEGQRACGRKSERHRSQETEKGLRPFGTGVSGAGKETSPFYFLPTAPSTPPHSLGPLWF